VARALEISDVDSDKQRINYALYKYKLQNNKMKLTEKTRRK